jgi:hypothetical protein
MSVAKEIEHSFSILGMMVFAKDHLTWKEKLCFIKTILNLSEKFKSFVYDTVTFEMVDTHKALVIDMKARKNTRPICLTCMRKHSVYDTQKARLYEYIPILGFNPDYAIGEKSAFCHPRNVLSGIWF